MTASLNERVYDALMAAGRRALADEYAAANSDVGTEVRNLSFNAEEYGVEFSDDSTIDSWWIHLNLLDSDVEDGFIRAFLGLTDVEAMNLSARLVEMVGLGRARSEWDWRPTPIPEHDGTAMLKRLLRGIGETWDRGADMPDWRENEYARGQIELTLETIRVTDDDEVLDSDDLKDRVWHWVRTEAWR